MNFSRLLRRLPTAQRVAVSSRFFYQGRAPETSDYTASNQYERFDNYLDTRSIMHLEKRPRAATTTLFKFLLTINPINGTGEPKV